MGNPRRRSHRKTRRRSHRRSSRAMILRNPVGGAISAVSAPVREMASKQFLVEISTLAVGFVLPSLVVSKFVPRTWRDTTLKGYGVQVAAIAVLSGAASLVSKRAARAVLIGGGVKLALDAYQDFVAPAISGIGGGGAALPPPPPAGAATYFGDRALETYFGDPGLGADGASIGAAFGSGESAFA